MDRIIARKINNLNEQDLCVFSSHFDHFSAALFPHASPSETQIPDITRLALLATNSHPVLDIAKEKYAVIATHFDRFCTINKSLNPDKEKNLFMPLIRIMRLAIHCRDINPTLHNEHTFRQTVELYFRLIKDKQSSLDKEFPSSRLLFSTSGPWTSEERAKIFIQSFAKIYLDIEDIPDKLLKHPEAMRIMLHTLILDEVHEKRNSYSERMHSIVQRRPELKQAMLIKLAAPALSPSLLQELTDGIDPFLLLEAAYQPLNEGGYALRTFVFENFPGMQSLILDLDNSQYDPSWLANPATLAIKRKEEIVNAYKDYQSLCNIVEHPRLDMDVFTEFVNKMGLFNFFTINIYDDCFKRTLSEKLKSLFYLYPHQQNQSLDYISGIANFTKEEEHSAFHDVILAVPTKDKDLLALPWIPSMIAATEAKKMILVFDQSEGSQLEKNRAICKRYPGIIYFLSNEEIIYLARRLNIEDLLHLLPELPLSYAGARNSVWLLSPVIHRCLQEGIDPITCDEDYLRTIFFETTLSDDPNFILMADDDFLMPQAQVTQMAYHLHQGKDKDKCLFTASTIAYNGRSTTKGGERERCPKWYSADYLKRAGCLCNVLSIPRWCLPIPGVNEECGVKWQYRPCASPLPKAGGPHLAGLRSSKGLLPWTEKESHKVRVDFSDRMGTLRKKAVPIPCSEALYQRLCLIPFFRNRVPIFPYKTPWKIRPVEGVDPRLVEKCSQLPDIFMQAVKPYMDRLFHPVRIAFNTGFGGHLEIRGNGPDMTWDKGLPLKWSEGNVWVGDLPKHCAPYEYKFVCITPDGQIQWEEGPNRTTFDDTITPLFPAK